MKIKLQVGNLEFYQYPIVKDSVFGEIRAKAFTENGIRVEFYSGTDVGIHLHKNALFVHYDSSEIEYD